MPGWCGRRHLPEGSMADGTGRWQEQPKCRHFAIAIRQVSFAMLNPSVICHAEPNSPGASLELAPPSDLYDALGEALRRVTPEDILG